MNNVQCAPIDSKNPKFQNLTNFVATTPGNRGQDTSGPGPRGFEVDVQGAPQHYMWTSTQDPDNTALEVRPGEALFVLYEGNPAVDDSIRVTVYVGGQPVTSNLTFASSLNVWLSDQAVGPVEVVFQVLKGPQTFSLSVMVA